VRALLVALLALTPVLASAQPPPRPASPDPTVPSPVNQFGLGWGVGMGFSSQLVGEALVEPGNAAIVDRTVIVLESSNVKPRFLAESHYTWRLGGGVGLGPAIWVQPGGNLFDAAGGGAIIELGDTGSDWSFNILGGVLLDFSVSHLHFTNREGMRVPAGRELLYTKGKELQIFFGFAAGR